MKTLSFILLIILMITISGCSEKEEVSLSDFIDDTSNYTMGKTNMIVKTYDGVFHMGKIDKIVHTRHTADGNNFVENIVYMDFVKSYNIEEVLCGMSVTLFDQYGDQIPSRDLELSLFDKKEGRDYDIRIQIIIKDDEKFDSVKFLAFEGVDYLNTYDGDTMIYELD